MMSSERRGAAPAHVSKRLYATIGLFIGVICVFGGYMLGRMTLPEIRRSNDVIPLNLTVAADSLFKKAKRISPKVIHHNDPEKIQAKLFSIFQCQAECGTINKYNLGDYVKSSINHEVVKLMKSINNATTYLDSLR
ncbi:uncharacterized protein LOC106140938 [Amyelois transitella]|uniref:uncharacterized protein LOC106140938 n=1 Tax=Amyelois transitella TaxID=680683 RepID=UPI00298F7E2E|nr:uncharacterized protein LOC106140938 [Amyelois transitella]